MAEQTNHIVIAVSKLKGDDCLFCIQQMDMFVLRSPFFTSFFKTTVLVCSYDFTVAMYIY